MYKLGEIMLIGGVLLFVIGGLGIILNIIPKSSSVIPILAALALIFVGAGISIKKKHSK
jgi:hypothetical protein